jgi:hypothetical protein
LSLDLDNVAFEFEHALDLPFDDFEGFDFHELLVAPPVPGVRL